MESPKILKIPQYFRNLQRLSEIIRVFVKYGFGDFLSRIRIHNYLSRFSFIKKQGLEDIPTAVRLRKVCEELGPTFIKLAQACTARSDAIPLSVLNEFTKLQDQAPITPFDSIKQIIKDELGDKYTDIAAIDPNPIGSASIGQVHRATLSQGAASKYNFPYEIVIKVRKPGVEKVIQTDLDIIMGIATLAEEYLPEARSIGIVKLVEELSRKLIAEVKFEKEAQNIVKFATLFGDQLKLPTPLLELSGEKLLILRYLEGKKIYNASSAKPRLARQLAAITLDSVFKYGFYHADLHPGNLLVTPRNELAFLDFGYMGSVDRIRRDHVLTFLRGIFYNRPENLANLLVESIHEPVNLDLINLRIQIAEILNSELEGDIDLFKITKELFEVARLNGFSPPKDLLNVGKALSAVQNATTILDPDFPAREFIISHLKRFQTENILSADNFNRSFEKGQEQLEIITEIPKLLRGILDKSNRGTLQLKILSKDLDKQASLYNQLVNRIIYCLFGISFLSLALTVAPNQEVSYILLILGGIFTLICLNTMRKS